MPDTMPGTITDQEIHDETLKAAEDEKAATLRLLRDLALVDERMIYASRGYASLWAYTVKYLKYDESQASERLNALKLMTAVSAVTQGLEAGELNLTTAATVQRFIQREERSTHKALPLEMKKEMVHAALSLSKVKIEKKLLAFSQNSEIHKKKVYRDVEKPVTTEYTRVSFTIDEETQELLEHFRREEGHEALGDIFKKTLKAYIKMRAARNQSHRVFCPTKVATHVSTSRYNPKPIRQEVTTRSQNRCEFVDPVTGKRCDSQAKLQFDHQIPLAIGGKTQISNMRLLCPTHNRLEAVRILGKEVMGKYIKV